MESTDSQELTYPFVFWKMFLEIKNDPSPHNLGKLWGCPLNYLGQGQIQALQIFILYFADLKEIDLHIFLPQGWI